MYIIYLEQIMHSVLALSFLEKRKFKDILVF